MVNGPTGELGFHANNYNEVNGYVIDISKESAEVMSKFNTIDRKFLSPHDVAVSSDGSMIFVAEINPPEIHKFVRKTEGAGSLKRTNETLKSLDHTTKSENIAKQQEVIDGSNNTNLLTTDKMLVTDVNGKMEHHHPTVTAVLVALLMSFFILLTLALAMLVARRRRRRGNVTNVAGSLSIGQPNELVYRKLVDSSQQLAERQQP